MKTFSAVKEDAKTIGKVIKKKVHVAKTKCSAILMDKLAESNGCEIVSVIHEGKPCVIIQTKEK